MTHLQTCHPPVPVSVTSASNQRLRAFSCSTNCPTSFHLGDQEGWVWTDRLPGGGWSAAGGVGGFGREGWLAGGGWSNVWKHCRRNRRGLGLDGHVTGRRAAPCVETRSRQPEGYTGLDGHGTGRRGAPCVETMSRQPEGYTGMDGHDTGWPQINLITTPISGGGARVSRCGGRWCSGSEAVRFPGRHPAGR